MTWCYESRGSSYHWILDLYQRLKLPIIPAVVQGLSKAVEERMAALEQLKTDRRKQGRIRQKVARQEDQAERKKWVKRQSIQHSYGADEEEMGEAEGQDQPEDETLVSQAKAAMEDLQGTDGSITVISGKKCPRCGSGSHKCSSHRSCPFNKKTGKDLNN